MSDLERLIETVMREATSSPGNLVEQCIMIGEASAEAINRLIDQQAIDPTFDAEQFAKQLDQALSERRFPLPAERSTNTIAAEFLEALQARSAAQTEHADWTAEDLEAEFGRDEQPHHMANALAERDALAEVVAELFEGLEAEIRQLLGSYQARQRDRAEAEQAAAHAMQREVLEALRERLGGLLPGWNPPWAALAPDQVADPTNETAAGGGEGGS